MNIKYSLFNPTGNITALVETKVDISKQPEIAEWILEKEPTCEQVGFISEGNEKADIFLRMAGGEFCGNATMSTVALYCKKAKIPVGTKINVNVFVEGTGLVPVHMEVSKDRFLGKVSMPKPLDISMHTFFFEGKEYTYPLVTFESISHIVADDRISPETAEKAIKQWCRELSVTGLGIMLVNEEKTAIRPLVYVTTPETMYWESSCGSGTTATGAYYFSMDQSKKSYSFSEPGGVLTIEQSSTGDYLLGGAVFL